jgi:hypothetical protein
MRRLHELVESGATLIGAQPATVPGLSNYPKAEEEVRTRAAALWGEAPGSEGERRVGKGRVVWGRSLSQIVETDRLPPDVEFRDASPGAKFDWLHRRRADMDLYFLSNQSATTARVEVWFRVEGKPPALWDAVTGEIRPLPEWRAAGGRTVVPLEFAPRQSWLVVFQKRAERPVRGGENFPAPQVAAEIAGPWEVAFDPEWGGPERVTFPQLEDWIRHSEPGIRYYSGKAAYHRVFDLPPAAPGGRLYLDLGVVKNLARVRVNGREAGIVWTAPWRVEITDLVRKQGNELEIEVVNLWPNRLIGDATLPPEKRRTVTNVRTYDTMASGAYGCQKCEARRKSGQGAELLSSGLLGPVRLLTLGIQK